MEDNNKVIRRYGIIIFVLAAFLRVYQLGESSLWHDEAFTWFFTRLPWIEMLDTVRLDGVNPPVYYLGTKIFIDLFGDSEFVLRIFSLIAGVSAIYFAWLLGKKAGGNAPAPVSKTYLDYCRLAAAFILSITASMLREPPACRCGYSLNVSRNCPTSACAGTNNHIWSA